MPPDPRTIAIYDSQAAEYAATLPGSTPDPSLVAFMAALPRGARVLDLGCGTGIDSAHMVAAGLDPDPVDAAPGMVAFARETHGVPARLGTFDDIAGHAVYGGVWASFSLLHAPRDALPRHLSAIAQALKPRGLLHVAMKTGTGAARDKKERLYTYVSEHELRDLLETAGFAVSDAVTGELTGFDGTPGGYVTMRGTKNA